MPCNDRAVRAALAYQNRNLENNVPEDLDELIALCISLGWHDLGDGDVEIDAETPVIVIYVSDRETRMAHAVFCSDAGLLFHDPDIEILRIIEVLWT